MYGGFWSIGLSREEWLQGRGLGSGPVLRICQLSMHSCFGFAFLSLDFWRHLCPIDVCPAPSARWQAPWLQRPFLLPPSGVPNGDGQHCWLVGQQMFTGRTNVQVSTAGLSPPTNITIIYVHSLRHEHHTSGKVHDKDSWCLSTKKWTGWGLGALFIAHMKNWKCQIR